MIDINLCSRCLNSYYDLSFLNEIRARISSSSSFKFFIYIYIYYNSEEINDSCILRMCQTEESLQAHIKAVNRQNEKKNTIRILNL